MACCLCLAAPSIQPRPGWAIDHSTHLPFMPLGPLGATLDCPKTSICMKILGANSVFLVIKTVRFWYGKLSSIVSKDKIISYEGLLRINSPLKLWYGILKCGFCRKVLLYECNSDQLTTFFHSLLGGFAVALLLHPPKSDDKMKKVGNWSELHS